MIAAWRCYSARREHLDRQGYNVWDVRIVGPGDRPLTVQEEQILEAWRTRAEHQAQPEQQEDPSVALLAARHALEAAALHIERQAQSPWPALGAQAEQVTRVLALRLRAAADQLSRDAALYAETLPAVAALRDQPRRGPKRAQRVAMQRRLAGQ